MDKEFLENKVLILVNQDLNKCLELSKLCNSTDNSKMIITSSSGLSGFIFVDCGKDHDVNDLTGENIELVQIGKVLDDGSVHCAQYCCHDLQNGDFIKFTNLISILIHI